MNLEKKENGFHRIYIQCKEFKFRHDGVTYTNSGPDSSSVCEDIRPEGNIQKHTTDDQ